MIKPRPFAGSLLALLLSLATLGDASAHLNRKPFDEAEFNRFMSDYPAASQWLSEKGRRYGGVNSPWVLSGMRYDRDFVKYLQEKGWEVERFFYLLDHINMGLLTSQAEARHDAVRARLNQQKEKMQTQMAEGQQQWQEQMREQTRSSAETARAQWSAQRERLANDPNIPPPQKQRMLAQMDRAQPPAGDPSAQVGQQQARMRQQQQAWLEEQKRQLMNNPTIPPQQKQEMMARMERSMATPQPPRPQQTAAPDPVEQQERVQARQKQWIEERMQEIRNNGMIPPAQKQQMLDQMQNSLNSLQTAAQRRQEGNELIPSQETTLIKNNRQKLTEMFFPEM
ncbi:MAG: hypothetical protein H7837_09995 [Magnetococcus sp. MYC-9]